MSDAVSNELRVVVLDEICRLASNPLLTRIDRYGHGEENALLAAMYLVKAVGTALSLGIPSHAEIRFRMAAIRAAVVHFANKIDETVVVGAGGDAVQLRQDLWLVTGGSFPRSKRGRNSRRSRVIKRLHTLFDTLLAVISPYDDWLMSSAMELVDHHTCDLIERWRRYMPPRFLPISPWYTHGDLELFLIRRDRGIEWLRRFFNPVNEGPPDISYSAK